MPAAPATSEMLAELSACAYRLGLRFAKAAEAAEDLERELRLFQLFDRCFFAVRVATALQLRLDREARAGRVAAGDGDADPPEIEAPEAERSETERPEPVESGRERLDAERDRETEPASVPVFLKTLREVAAGATALPGPAPAELPALRDLLARATGAPAAPRFPPSPLRERLAGSAALATASPALRPSPLLPGRRATGPPWRAAG